MDRFSIAKGDPPEEEPKNQAALPWGIVEGLYPKLPASELFLAAAQQNHGQQGVYKVHEEVTRQRPEPTPPTTGSPDYVEPLHCHLGYGEETEAQRIDRQRRAHLASHEHATSLPNPDINQEALESFLQLDIEQRALDNAREIVERRNRALGLHPLPPLADRNSRHTYPRMFIRPNDSGPYIGVYPTDIHVIENAENPNMLTVGLTFQVNPDLINRILPR